MVLEGSDLSSLTGLKTDSIVGFKYESSSWTQIPIQVDERDTVSAVDIYFPGPCPLPPFQCARVDIDLLTYTDPDTHTGADSDTDFDDDDELVFMAEDAGDKAPANTYPSTVDSGAARAEVELVDTLSNDTTYVYLFANTDDLDQTAGKDYVDYVFTLNAGDYSNYNVGTGTNPENSYVTTATYQQHFADRWIRDEIKIFAGDSSDIFDRHKPLFPKYACSHTDEGYSYGEGAMVANIDGPVRAIRAYIGSWSGPLTERHHKWYEDNEEIVTYLRVHAISGQLDIYDYSSDAIGMEYYNSINTGGVTIDGTHETLTQGELEWEMVSGEQGTMFMAHELETNLTLDSITSRYIDRTNNSGADNCTGDNHAYGWSGPGLINIPDTDPFSSPNNYLRAYRRVLYDGADKEPADVEFFLDNLNAPLEIHISQSSSKSGYAQEGDNNDSQSGPYPATSLQSKLYPNPVEGTYEHAVHSVKRQTVLLTWSDITGKVVQRATWHLSKGLNQRSFDMSTMPGGMYFVTLSDLNGTLLDRVRICKY